MPVFSPDLNAIPGQLVGVVGQDVRVSDLSRDGGADFRTVFDRIIERTSVCLMSDLSPCQLQVWNFIQWFSVFIQFYPTVVVCLEAGMSNSC